MTEETQSALISRRTVFSLLGVALPATIFAVSQGAAQTPGMERREERREERRGSGRRKHTPIAPARGRA